MNDCLGNQNYADPNPTRNFNEIPTYEIHLFLRILNKDRITQDLVKSFTLQLLLDPITSIWQNLDSDSQIKINTSLFHFQEE